MLWQSAARFAISTDRDRVSRSTSNETKKFFAFDNCSNLIQNSKLLSTQSEIFNSEIHIETIGDFEFFLSEEIVVLLT